VIAAEQTERQYVDWSELFSAETVRHYREAYNGKGFAWLVAKLSDATLTFEEADVLLHDVMTDSLLAFATEFATHAGKGMAVPLAGPYLDHLTNSVKVRLGAVPDDKRQEVATRIVDEFTTRLASGRIRVEIFDIYAENGQLMFMFHPSALAKVAA
jgi:hypothetical protein